MKINSGDSGIPVHGTVHGVTLNDSGTFGGKLTAWYLPRKYNWQPQVGFELDFTRFTADMDPQLRGADGTVTTPGFQLGAVRFTDVRGPECQYLGCELAVSLSRLVNPGSSAGTNRAIRWCWRRRTTSRPVLPGRFVSRGGLRSCWAVARRDEIFPDEKSCYLRRIQADLVLSRLYVFRRRPSWIRGNMVGCDQYPCRRCVYTFLAS